MKTSTTILAFTLLALATAPLVRAQPTPEPITAEKPVTAGNDKTLLTTPDKAAVASVNKNADATGIDATLKEMEDAWTASLLKEDHGAAVVEAMLTADFAGVGANGKIQNKADKIAALDTNGDTYTLCKNEGMSVHIYGSNVAVVCGTSIKKGTHKGGMAFTRTYVWAHTWMEQGGQWQCIADAGTHIPKK